MTLIVHLRTLFYFYDSIRSREYRDCPLVGFHILTPTISSLIPGSSHLQWGCWWFFSFTCAEVYFHVTQVFPRSSHLSWEPPGKIDLSRKISFLVSIQYKVSIGRRICTDRNESQFIGMHGSRETYEPKYKRNAGGVSYLPSEKIECRGVSYLSAVGARPCASCSPIVSMTSWSHGQTLHQKNQKAGCFQGILVDLCYLVTKDLIRRLPEPALFLVLIDN